MTALRPPLAVQLEGECMMRIRIIALPKERVRQMLPPGLALGPYPPEMNIDPGSHPVLLCFNDVFRLQLSCPSLIPSLTYHEFQIGIPYIYLSSGPPQEGVNGPYYFMPRLYLDRWLPIIGGVTFWGFAKQPASIRVTENSYVVTGPAGESVASLFWRPGSERAQVPPLIDDTILGIIRAILKQTLISRVPAGAGPYFALSEFVRTLQIPLSMETTVEVQAMDIPLQMRERLQPDEWVPGISDSVLGGFFARVPWVLSLPYIPTTA